eukprot:4496930-Prymnesium_polylepis.2
MADCVRPWRPSQGLGKTRHRVLSKRHPRARVWRECTPAVAAGPTVRKTVWRTDSHVHVMSMHARRGSVRRVMGRCDAARV